MDCMQREVAPPCATVLPPLLLLLGGDVDDEDDKFQWVPLTAWHRQREME